MNVRAQTLAAVILFAACAQPEKAPAAGQIPSESRLARETRIRELEQQARALARTDGCGEVGQCRTAPVGAKGCGGPRAYLVYCKATTDEAALLRALDELKRVEEEYNRAEGIASDCMMITPPAIRLDGNACRAATP
jgi:hypothetical protein